MQTRIPSSQRKALMGGVQLVMGQTVENCVRLGSQKTPAISPSIRPSWMVATFAMRYSSSTHYKTRYLERATGGVPQAEIEVLSLLIHCPISGHTSWPLLASS